MLAIKIDNPDILIDYSKDTKDFKYIEELELMDEQK